MTQNEQAYAAPGSNMQEYSILSRKMLESMARPQGPFSLRCEGPMLITIIAIRYDPSGVVQYDTLGQVRAYWVPIARMLDACETQHIAVPESHVWL